MFMAPGVAGDSPDHWKSTARRPLPMSWSEWPAGVEDVSLTPMSTDSSLEVAAAQSSTRLELNGGCPAAGTRGRDDANEQIVGSPPWAWVF